MYIWWYTVCVYNVCKLRFLLPNWLRAHHWFKMAHFSIIIYTLWHRLSPLNMLLGYCFIELYRLYFLLNHCFKFPDMYRCLILGQETLLSLLSTGWVQEQIRAWFHNRTEIIWGPYVILRFCHISSHVKLRRSL